MPISPMDEYMCHQSVNTFDELTTSDPQWTERVFFSAFDKTGKYLVMFGLGKYTNRNVMDASIGISVDGKTQYNIRASRALYPDVDNYQVGPMSYHIVEPLKKVRVVTDDNDYGIKCDLTYTGGTEPYRETPDMLVRRSSRVVNHMIRMYQIGTVEGWIEIEGERIEVTTDTWWGMRDRSWGIRSNTGEFSTSEGENTTLFGGMQPPGNAIPYRWSFLSIQVDDWAASYEFAETPDCKLLGPALGHIQYDDGRPDAKIVHVDNTWDFDRKSKKLHGVHSILHLQDGSTVEVKLEPISVGFRRPGGGGYGGYKGMAQGTWMGENFLDGEKMTLTDELCYELHFVEDYPVRVICGDKVGYGVVQPQTPGVSELITPTE